MSVESQLQRLNKQMDDLIDRLDFYAQVLYDQGVAINMALSDDVAVLMQAIVDERAELQARFDELKQIIADGGDTAALQAQIDALQAQLDAGSAAVAEATTAVQALSDTGE